MKSQYCITTYATKESKASTSVNTQREYLQGVLCGQEKSGNHFGP